MAGLKITVFLYFLERNALLNQQETLINLVPMNQIPDTVLLSNFTVVYHLPGIPVYHSGYAIS